MVAGPAVAEGAGQVSRSIQPAVVIAATVMNAFPETTPLWLIVLSGAAVGLMAAWIAGLVNGILTVTISKAEITKPRQIAVR